MDFRIQMALIKMIHQIQGTEIRYRGQRRKGVKTIRSERCLGGW